jgi:putative ABC transport system permease protein
MIRLFRQFVGRRLLGERTRTLTTVVGIAAGIAMVVAIQLTNASSVRGFETALETVSGRASVEITAPGGVDETLLPDLGWLRQFGAVSPVIEGEMALVTVDATAARPRRTEVVKVLGVDILRDRTVRDYAVAAHAASSGDADAAAGPELTAQQFLTLLTSPQSVVITEKLARRRGYALGDEIRLMTGDRVVTYVIRALL